MQLEILDFPLTVCKVADMADAARDGARAYIDFSREDLRRWRRLRGRGDGVVPGD